ncbi:MAG: VCBS repeat-containing protein [Candidatus Eisenbacteria bacterium]|uniref:VCBS repeat-containing protein n=1 Tax=Eiseniibacteriota bacterium TaxID=2212470 RepID=A0A948W4Z4_UNCEI|nr:VCBS repeat-containing protein [Candidatus Eisenbacteria bacterium]MBU1949941.1 VCBS repeat-containing protein [Candidatus Eisenbacteria bacterium]MBU2692767.1 VCBS repeat-containing protein [Candidatus Eisenbacteria bacterium]
MKIGSWNRKFILRPGAAEDWFGDAIKTVLPEEPANLAFGYFNPDTLLDVAYVTGTSHLHILFNAGNGHFSYSNMYVAGKSDLAAGDPDHFGGDDIIVVGYPGEVEMLMYLNEGNGLFEPPILLSPPAVLNHIRIGDLDSDGDNDVVAFGVYSQLCIESIFIFWGNGQGFDAEPDIYEC